MHKFVLALILLSVPVSTSALAHSGTEQDEKASAPDVQRLCRKLMDKAILPFWPASSENRAKLSAACRYVLVSQPRTMTIGFPFGVGPLSSLNTGFGDFEIWWSRFRRKKPAPFVDEHLTACRSRWIR